MFSPVSKETAVPTVIVFLAVFAAGVGGAHAYQDDACVVPDDGTGTGEIPPGGCSYLSPDEVYMIIDGLPPGATIELKPSHQDFVCRKTGICGVPGGNLGGEVEDFDMMLILDVTGLEDLVGFERVLAIPVAVQTHSGPRNPGDPEQSFPTDLYQMAGSLPPGDPDFAFLQITAGTAFGLPSPGQTALTRLGPPGSDFQVDSFFDVYYQIDFQGAPGGALEGLSGSTQGQLLIQSVGERDPCIVADDGSGTAELPPEGCDYLSPEEAFLIIGGMPPGGEIELDPRHTGFICPNPGGCGEPGGNLGGEVENFTSTLVFQLEQESTGFRRTLRLPAMVTTHSGPRTPGDDLQSFPTDVFSLFADLPPGDPDFASLTITAGTDNGLPSPGYTSLTNLGDGTFNVDSFFDISYQIDFTGAPGGHLEGLSGSTTSRVRVVTRSGRTDSVEDDNGLGTPTLPPEGGEYVSPDDVYLILDGLPPGATIELEPSHWKYFCTTIPCSQPGGSLGGEMEVFDSTLDIELRGTGSLTGFQRQISLPTTMETHSGTRMPSAGTEFFESEMFSMVAALPPGDPDFDQLSITAGSNFGLPSPGHATLIDQGDGSFMIDSFFDVTYQIDFVGAPGGQLDGLAGSTVGTLRTTAGERKNPPAPAHNITIELVTSPLSDIRILFSGMANFTLSDDIEPTSPSWRTFNNLTVGSHLVSAAVPTNWVARSIQCNDPDSGTVTDPGAGQVTVDLDLGEAVTCIFDMAVPLLFEDGFESGDTSLWSGTVSPR